MGLSMRQRQRHGVAIFVLLSSSHCTYLLAIDLWMAFPYDIEGHTLSLLHFSFRSTGKLGLSLRPICVIGLNPEQKNNNNNGRRQGFDVRVKKEEDEEDEESDVLRDMDVDGALGGCKQCTNDTHRYMETDSRNISLVQH